MGDHTFRLGNVSRLILCGLMLSENLLDPLTRINRAQRADVHHLRLRTVLRCRPCIPSRHRGDFIGHKALSAFCQPQHGRLHTAILRKMRDDPYFRSLMRHGLAVRRNRVDAEAHRPGRRQLGWPGPLPTDVWRVSCLRIAQDRDDVGAPQVLACLLKPRSSRDSGIPPLPDARAPEPALLDPVRSEVGSELAHLSSGDIITYPTGRPAGHRAVEEHRRHNSLLLTEQCDNYCLMCSQPPKDRDDSWLFDRAKRIISLLPETRTSLGLTGGEPTLHADGSSTCWSTAGGSPGLSMHLLSNGRRFADLLLPADTPPSALPTSWSVSRSTRPSLACTISSSRPRALSMRPSTASLTWPRSARHRAQGRRPAAYRSRTCAAWRSSSPGTCPSLTQVALMGLEMTGLARPNSALVWVDPADYQHELAEAVDVLATAGITTRDLQPSAMRARSAPLAATRFAPSATGRTTTWTSATPAQSATLAAASSPRAATASAQHLHPIS